MGLDMYLYRDYYVKNWEHMSDAEKHTIVIFEGNKKSSIPTEKICTIRTDEMYWRKANAIHAWFVDNVQDGTDDCGTYYVSKENLKELLNAVTLVLGDHSLAAELLPSQSGFFFGGTDFDEYYFRDLEHTKEGLATLLEIDDDGDFYYHSSW